MWRLNKSYNFTYKDEDKGYNLPLSNFHLNAVSATKDRNSLADEPMSEKLYSRQVRKNAREIHVRLVLVDTSD